MKENTTIPIVKKELSSFIKNNEGTHFDASFTRATAFSQAKHGTWLQNPTQLELSNRELRSKEVGQDIKKLKSLVKQYNEEAKGKSSNNSEHVIPQSVLFNKIEGIKVNPKEYEISTTARSLIVNGALAYQEDRHAHENHSGTRWLIEKKNKNDGSTRINEYDKENKLYYSKDGKVFLVVNGGVGKNIDEILKHESQRETYTKNLSSILKTEKNISATIQMNQIEYAHQSNVRKKTCEKTDNLTKDISNYSFYHMAKAAQRVIYADEEVINSINTDKNIKLNAIDVDNHDKMEMIVARLTVSLGRHPYISEVKEITNKLDIDVPEDLKALKGEINPDDLKTPFYEYSKH